MNEIIIPGREDFLSLLNGARMIPFSPNFISVDNSGLEQLIDMDEFDPTSRYVISPEVRTFASGNWQVLFQRIPPTLAFVRNETYRKIDTNGVVLLDLDQTKILYDTGFLDKQGHQIDRTRIMKERFKESKPFFKATYLFPTDFCNLNCHYCNVEHNMPKDYVHGHMSIPTAKKSIDLFIENLQAVDSKDQCRNIYISFYGGEPLMNRHTLTFAIQYSKRRLEEIGLADRSTVCLMTNGTLINEDTAKLLEEHKMNITLSIDGLKKNHDAMRVLNRKDNKGSFESALRGYELIRNRCNVTILCTVGNHNIEDLETIADYFSRELYPTAVEFSLVRSLKFGTNPAGIKSLDEAYEKLYNAHKILINQGIPDNNFSRRILTFANKLVYSYNFSRCGDTLYVAPKGRIYPCDSYLGMKKKTEISVDSSLREIKSNETIQAWFNRHPFSIEECLQCSSLSICGGGCPYNAEVTKGSIHDTDDQLCRLNHFVLDRIIDEVQGAVIK